MRSYQLQRLKRLRSRRLHVGRLKMKRKQRQMRKLPSLSFKKKKRRSRLLEMLNPKGRLQRMKNRPKRLLHDSEKRRPRQYLKERKLSLRGDEKRQSHRRTIKMMSSLVKAMTSHGRYIITGQWARSLPILHMSQRNGESSLMYLIHILSWTWQRPNWCMFMASRLRHQNRLSTCKEKNVEFERFEPIRLRGQSE